MNRPREKYSVFDPIKAQILIDLFGTTKNLARKTGIDRNICREALNGEYIHEDTDELFEKLFKRFDPKAMLKILDEEVNNGHYKILPLITWVETFQTATGNPPVIPDDPLAYLETPAKTPDIITAARTPTTLD